MSVTVIEVQTNLGRTLTPEESDKVSLWLGWAQGIIAARLGDLNALDQGTLSMVVVEVVSAKLRNEEGLLSHEVAVDDGREVRRYRDSTATSLTDLLEPWWDTLATDDSVSSGAFTVTPYGAPDRSVDAW